MQTRVGPVRLAVPRDRAGTFEPVLVPKRAGRISGGLDDMIISLCAHGMSRRHRSAGTARLHAHARPLRDRRPSSVVGLNLDQLEVADPAALRRAKTVRRARFSV